MKESQDQWNRREWIRLHAGEVCKHHPALVITYTDFVAVEAFCTLCGAYKIKGQWDEGKIPDCEEAPTDAALGAAGEESK